MASDTVAFQQSFSTKHPEFIQAAQAAANLAEEIFADTIGAALTLPQVVFRALAQTVLNSFYSITVLAQHGCGVDAQKIVRSMFETSVVLTLRSGRALPRLLDCWVLATLACSLTTRDQQERMESGSTAPLRYNTRRSSQTCNFSPVIDVERAYQS